MRSGSSGTAAHHGGDLHTVGLAHLLHARHVDDGVHEEVKIEEEHYHGVHDAGRVEAYVTVQAEPRQADHREGQAPKHRGNEQQGYGDEGVPLHPDAQPLRATSVCRRRVLKFEVAYPRVDCYI